MKRIILGLLLLSACTSPEKIEASKVKQCVNMGAPIGSDKYYECRRGIEEREMAVQAQYQEQSRIQQEAFQREQQRLRLLNAETYRRMADDNNPPVVVYPQQPVFQHLQKGLNCVTKQGNPYFERGQIITECH